MAPSMPMPSGFSSGSSIHCQRYALELDCLTYPTSITVKDLADGGASTGTSCLGILQIARIPCQ